MDPPAEPVQWRREAAVSHSTKGLTWTAPLVTRLMGRSDEARERDRGESGEFENVYDDEVFLTVLDEEELPTTTEVAEAVGCDRRTAYYRLTKLESEGVIESRRVGGTLVWRRRV